MDFEPGIPSRSIKVLYTTRPLTEKLGDILFYDRIRRLISANPSAERSLDLYLTGFPSAEEREKGGVRKEALGREKSGSEGVSIHHRRITHEDLISALGPVEERRGVVAYVCGPARMTDEFVDVLQGADGMIEERVLCEKWW